MTTIATVKVIAGRDLASKDSNGLSDPYCYVTIGVPPHVKANRVKTKTIFKDLNPVWNESFDLEVSDVLNSELYIEVWDYDKIGSHDFMGKVQLPMTLVEGRKINNWFELQSRGKKSDGEIKGSIHLMIELNKNANPKSLLEPTQTIRKQPSKATIRRGATATEILTPITPIPITYRERDKRFIDIVSEEVLNLLSPQERKRQEVIFEFINTEELFRNDIKIICDIFLRRIRNENIFENAADISAIFSNIEEILPATENMVRVLKELQKQNAVITSLGKVLLTQIDSLKVFVKYCSNQKKASSLVEQFRNNREIFAAFLERNEKEEVCRCLPLDAFLVKPLQRLCKYPLLLREILKETSEEDGDYNNLIEADRRIKLVVDEANERTREQERLLRRDELRQLLKPTPYGEIMERNDFELEITTQYQPASDSKPSEATVILLPQFLIVALKKREVKATCLSLRFIDFYSVEDNEDTKNRIEINVNGGENFSVIFSKADDKSLWLNTLDRLQIQFFSKIISDRTDSEDILIKEMETLANENAQLHSQITILKNKLLSIESDHNNNNNNNNNNKNKLMPIGIKRADTPLPSKEERIIILIKGYPYTGKSTVCSELISHFNQSGNLTAYFKESNYLSILTNKSKEERYRQSSHLIADAIRSLNRLDPSYNIVIVEGVFPYENEIEQFEHLATSSHLSFLLFSLEVPIGIRKEREFQNTGAFSHHLFESTSENYVSDHTIFIDNSGDLKVTMKTILTEIANKRK